MYKNFGGYLVSETISNCVWACEKRIQTAPLNDKPHVRKQYPGPYQPAHEKGDQLGVHNRKQGYNWNTITLGQEVSVNGGWIVNIGINSLENNSRALSYYGDGARALLLSPFRHWASMLRLASSQASRDSDWDSLLWIDWWYQAQVSRRKPYSEANTTRNAVEGLLDQGIKHGRNTLGLNGSTRIIELCSMSVAFFHLGKYKPTVITREPPL